MKIKDILDAPVGFTPDKVSILVTSCYGRIASDEGDYKKKTYRFAWSYETVIGKDDTGEIKIVFKNMPNTNIRAKDDIAIVPKFTDKHGLTGIKLELDDKKNKQLIVTPSAAIVKNGTQQQDLLETDENKTDTTKQCSECKEGKLIETAKADYGVVAKSICINAVSQLFNGVITDIKDLDDKTIKRIIMAGEVFYEWCKDGDIQESLDEFINTPF